MDQESRQKMTFEGNLFIKIPCLLVVSANALEIMQWICFPSSQVSLSLTFFHLETLEMYAFVKHLSRQSNESLRKDLLLHSDLKIYYSPTRNSSYINRKEERLSTLNETLSFYIRDEWTRGKKRKDIIFFIAFGKSANLLCQFSHNDTTKYFHSSKVQHCQDLLVNLTF